MLFLELELELELWLDKIYINIWCSKFIRHSLCKPQFCSSYHLNYSSQYIQSFFLEQFHLEDSAEIRTFKRTQIFDIKIALSLHRTTSIALKERVIIWRQRSWTFFLPIPNIQNSRDAQEKELLYNCKISGCFNLLPTSLENLIVGTDSGKFRKFPYSKRTWYLSYFQL